MSETYNKMTNMEIYEKSNTFVSGEDTKCDVAPMSEDSQNDRSSSLSIAHLLEAKQNSIQCQCLYCFE